MKDLVWKLVIVAVMVLGLGVALPAGADEETWLEVTGIISDYNRNISTIVIQTSEDDSITIIGFPFNNLEAQLEDELHEDGFIIEEGDCLTVKYSENELKSGEIVNKWESLTMYSPGCLNCLLENETVSCLCDTNYCSDENEDMTREPKKNRPKPGLGWGDKTHEHKGPPGQNKKN